MKTVTRSLWTASVLSTSIALAASLCLTAQIRAQEIDTWTGGGSSTAWTNSGNWTYSGNGTSPQAGDSLVFAGSQTANNNTFAAGTAFYGITFSNGASPFTLSGNSVLLSGQTNGVTVGITNSSTVTQTIALNLGLDWGYYTFDSPSGGVALNGTLTRNPGAVGYFDHNITSTSLANDNSGLISGLGGAGLTYNDAATNQFSGLATINGSDQIVTYSGFQNVYSTPPGGGIGSATALSSGGNIEITDSAADTYTLAGGTGTTYANTIFLSAASANTLALAGASGSQTLQLGAVSGIGGIYVADSTTNEALTVGTGSSTVLTAGATANGAGTIVLGVNGAGSNTQAYVNAKIANNGTGAVTVISTGTGTTTFGNIANTYSGGTYIDQGQIQVSNTAGFGTGAVHVAGGASAVTDLSGSPTVANSFFLSPGYGNPGAPSYGALVNGGGGNSSTYTYSGTITLMGNPVAAPPGDRVVDTGAGSAGYATGLGVAFTGLTTGTGTLDLYTTQSMFFILKYSGSNSYQGGIIIESAPGAYNLTRTGVNGEIPSGPGTGNMTLIAGAGGVARFDVNGHLQTINGLIAPNNGNTANQIVGEIQGNGNSSTGTLTLGANGNNNGGPFTFNGVLTDTGLAKTALNLVKVGNGGQTLAGPNPNTYVGTTTVESGTLALAQGATIANSTNISVWSGGTLDVSGLSAPFDVVAQTSLGPPQVLDCIGAINGGSNSVIIDGTINPFVSTIGTYTNIGALTLDGGATYVWEINNATGAAGKDPGWSLVQVQGGVMINASSGAPLNINLTSLKGDAPGNATNFNPSTATTWTILQSSAGITNFNSSAFNLNSTAFSNNLGGGNFSIQLSGDQKSVQLVFTPAASICIPLTNDAIVGGQTAEFSVGVCADAQPATYQWYWNSSPINNGEASGSGSTISIVSTASGSTLMIPNAGDADEGTYSVAVTGTIGGTPTTSATLTIIDPPGNLSVSESSANGVTLSGGGVDYLTVTAGSGTPPYSYVWSFDGVPLSNGGAFSGVNTATLSVDAGMAEAGTYTVLVENAAGGSTNDELIIPYVTQVPNQYIYESFDSYTAQTWNDESGIPPTSPSWEGVTNLYNQATGEPAYWYNGAGSGPTDSAMAVTRNQTSSRNGGFYPWPGLASDSGQAPNGSENELFWSGGEFGGNTADNHLRYTTNTFPSGSKIYFSFIFNADNPRFANTSAAGADLFLGLGGTGTDFTCKLATEVTSSELATNGQQYTLGLFKGDGDTISQSEPYGEWATNYTLLGEDLFIVGCYTVVSGGTSATDDTVALWLNPPTNSFYTNEANVPPPTLGPSSFGANNGPVNEVIVRNTGLIGEYSVLDLRIGSTWASVTPPSGPTLSLANQTLVSGQTVVFASQNAGNPVDTYSWQFNGGPPLSDNSPNTDGSYYLGSSTPTLIIVNAQAAELGTYTVNGVNYDYYGNQFNGSASASLSLAQPALTIAQSAANALISWPTNYSSFVLEETGSLASPINWTSVAPNLITTVGTNYTATINARTGDQFFRLHYKP